MAARAAHRPVGSPDRRGMCIRAVPLDEGVRWRRAIGPRIRQVREDLDVSASELAAAIGVVDTTVLRWERGDGWWPLSRIYQVAAALGVTVADLLGEDA